jgi:glucose/arabinose dehydrogenase
MKKLFIYVMVIFSISIYAQNEVVSVEGHRFVPEKREFSDDLVEQLKVPEGFTIAVFAKDLDNARMMAVTENGTVYLTRRKNEDVMMLRDSNGDGKADVVTQVVSGYPAMHGIALRGNEIFLCTDTKLLRGELGEDGMVTNIEEILTDLPDGGQHPNRTIAFGPDEYLYVSVGSSCNACEEPNKEHATMLRMRDNGSERMIFAEGLRNTIGFGWHPVTRDFWGMDHGSDMRGDDIPKEELNRIVEGRHYGWPFCYEEKLVDDMAPKPDEGTKEDICSKSEAPVLLYQAHSSPLAMLFYTGNQFPEEYQNNAFIAMRGSWNRSEAVGYKLIRLKFNQNGEPEECEDFITGFLLEGGKEHFARLAGLAQMPDGSLLLSDDDNGVIYRISYNR